MNNQNSPYPDMADQPLIGSQNHQPQPRPPVNNHYPINQQPQPHPPINNPYPTNQQQSQGYMPPHQHFPPPPPPQPHNNYPQPNPYHNQNQGFNPNQGQGFNPNQGQGFIPPNNGYIPGGGLLCPICRRQTDNFPKKVPGGVTWIWCFCLFIFTGLGCCIPFCVDSCLDTELVCVVCQCVKGKQEAKCC